MTPAAALALLFVAAAPVAGVLLAVGAPVTAGAAAGGAVTLGLMAIGAWAADEAVRWRGRARGSAGGEGWR